MWRMAYGYLPSRTASPPLDRYQIMLLGDRGTRVWTTCPRLLPDSGTTGSRTRDLSSRKSNALTTTLGSLNIWISGTKHTSKFSSYYFGTLWSNTTKCRVGLSIIFVFTDSYKIVRIAHDWARVKRLHCQVLRTVLHTATRATRRSTVRKAYA